MKSVLVHEPVPAEIEAVIQRRQALGQDRFDEVWEGVYHVTPGPGGPHAYLLNRLNVLLDPAATGAGLIGATGFNLGSGPDDYRVPDCGFLRTIPTDVWVPSAVIVVEILSPGDETFEKFDFYAHHGVEEIFVVDPTERSFHIWRESGGSYVQSASSDLLRFSVDDLMEAIVWPA